MSIVMGYPYSDPAGLVTKCSGERWANICSHLSVLSRGLLSQDIRGARLAVPYVKLGFNPFFPQAG